MKLSFAYRMPALAFVALASAAISLSAAQAPSPSKSRRMEIVLEKKDGAKARAMDPGHVFDQGDLVRFRFQPTFDGYLYVMNLSTSGKYTLLFPKDETGRENHVQNGSNYVIPASERGWFRITGPPGFETVYFVVTPAEIGSTSSSYTPLPTPVQEQPLPSDMRPRCDDTIFKARGDCVDLDAGPQTVKQNDALPENLSNLPGTTSRDLIVIRKPKSSVVASEAPLEGPAIYTFRIAHK